MNSKFIFVCTAGLLLSSLPLVAQPVLPPAAGPRTSLFDGKTLKGWEVLKCEAAVENGSILIKGGNGVVQTGRKYSDFIFEYEWKPLKADAWDSGVYFRYDSIPTNQPWPRRYQANLRKGDEGNVGGLKGATSHGLCKDGEWNKFKLTVKGTTAAMDINDQPAWKGDGLEDPNGFISLQCEVPGGGQCLFRNIYITELK